MKHLYAESDTDTLISETMQGEKVVEAIFERLDGTRYLAGPGFSFSAPRALMLDAPAQDRLERRWAPYALGVAGGATVVALEALVRLLT